MRGEAPARAATALTRLSRVSRSSEHLVVGSMPAPPEAWLGESPSSAGRLPPSALAPPAFDGGLERRLAERAPLRLGPRPVAVAADAERAPGRDLGEPPFPEGPKGAQPLPWSRWVLKTPGWHAGPATVGRPRCCCPADYY